MLNLRLALVDKSLRILWSTHPFIGRSVLEFVADEDQALVRDKFTELLLDHPTVEFTMSATVHDPPDYAPHPAKLLVTMFRIDGIDDIAALLVGVSTTNGAIRDQDHEILRLLTADYDLGQIADELGRSKSTVEHRVGKLKISLNRKTLPGLAAEAVRRGLTFDIDG